MNHYAKIGAVIMRSFGLLMLFYAAPVLVWGVARMVAGAATASDGHTPIGAAFARSLVYGVAGALLFTLAKPLGRLAARGFDEATALPPAP